MDRVKWISYIMKLARGMGKGLGRMGEEDNFTWEVFVHKVKGEMGRSRR